jgi:hypothetical protein
MTATARAPEPAREQEEIAAAIRRIVTRAFIREQTALGAADPDTALALPLLLTMRPDRIPEAVIAHQALVKQVRSDLEDGIASPHHFKLIELLFNYLDASGYRFYWERERWENHGVVTP